MIATLWRYTPLFMLIVIWEAGTRLGIISKWALPAFDSVVMAWVGLLDGGEVLVHARASLMRGGAGPGLASVAGTVLRVLLGWVRPGRISFNPRVPVFY